MSQAWLTDKQAQRRYADRAEDLLPDKIFEAREDLIFKRSCEQRGPSIECNLVRYDNDDNRYRAHGWDDDGNELHVTDFGSFRDVQRMLRGWAVANNLFYGRNKDDRTAIVSLGRE